MLYTIYTQLRNLIKHLLAGAFWRGTGVYSYLQWKTKALPPPPLLQNVLKASDFLQITRMPYSIGSGCSHGTY